MTHAQNLRKHPLPEPEELAKWFRYCPMSGNVWYVSARTGKIKRAKSTPSRRTSGYRNVSVTLNGVCVHLRAHRVAFALMEGYWPKCVDHINGDRSDNRWWNLREVSVSENLAFSRVQQRKTPDTKTDGDGYYGVNFQRKQKLVRVLFTRWRDALRFEQYLQRGIRDHGPDFVPEIPTPEHRLKREYHRKSKYKTVDKGGEGS